jgi:glycosyltransferase involved in cell wall biosynthesis
VPVVQALHGLADSDRRTGSQTGTPARLEELLARNATTVTATCTDDIDALIRMGCRRSRVSVLPSGIDVDTFGVDASAVPARQARHRIVAVAQNFSPSHGMRRVITALPALAAAELVLIAHGTDGDARALLAVAARLGVADRTRVVTTTDDREIAAWLRSADVAVCPSECDSDTRMVLRAMACGLPVVGADTGGSRDAIIAEVTGLLVPSGNPLDMSRALRSILRENVLREGMGLAGRTRARSRYCWDRIATDAEAVYEATRSLHAPAMSQ